MIISKMLNNLFIKRNCRISYNVINNIRYYHVHKNNIVNNNNKYNVRYFSANFQKENDDALLLVEKMSTNDDSKVTGNTANVKRICNDILSLNFIEINQLLHRLQDRLQLDKNTNMMIGTSDDMNDNVNNNTDNNNNKADAKATEKAKEKEAFDIKLNSVDAKSKIKIIKEIRVITGLGLKEAKEMVEKAPIVVKTGVKKDEAEKIKKLLVDNGATIDIL